MSLAPSSAPQPSRYHMLLRALARKKATWIESFVSRSISRQGILRNLYVFATILTIPLALISASWMEGNETTAPLWATTVAVATCGISLLVYLGAILDLLLFPRSQSLAGSNRRAYERLSELDPELHGIIASFKESSTFSIQNQSELESFKAEAGTMKLDFSHFLDRHLKRTKRSLFAVILLSLACIILSFSSVYIALYTLQPEVITAKPATTSSRGSLGWIVYGLECSLENVTALGKHSAASLMAQLSAITEALTFFFLISVVFSTFLDLSREAFEITPKDLAQEFEQDLLSAATGHANF